MGVYDDGEGREATSASTGFRKTLIVMRPLRAVLAPPRYSPRTPIARLCGGRR